MSKNAKTILILEDDENISHILCFLLERFGYHIEKAEDGKAGMEIIDRIPPPALIISDIMMPYHSGFEILEKVRAKANWKSIPVVMLSAKSGGPDIVKATELGANDYLVKPFEPEVLMAKVKRFITNE